MKKLGLIILSFITAASLWAQEESDCSKILKKAQLTYDAGEIEKVEGMLTSCLEDGFSRAEKTEALKLIVLSHVFEDNIPLAENQMVELLKTNPDFKPKSTDHQELKDLYSRFRTDPLIILDFMVGINFTEANVIKYHSVNPMSPYWKDYYTKIGINLAATANYLVAKNTRVNLGIAYKNTNFGIWDFYGYDGSSFDTDDYQTIDASISASLFGLTMGASREFGKRKLVPFTSLALATDFYLSSYHTIKRSYTNYEDAVAEVTGEKINTGDIINGINVSVMNETGIRYKIGLTGKLFFSIRTSIGLINQTYTANRYANNELLYKYYFVPDDYLLHNLSINIGYSHLIYKPKKLKNK